MARIDEILIESVARHASDIHVSAEEPIRFRIDGDLVTITDPLSAQEVHDLMFEFLTELEREKLKTHKNLDRSYAVETAGNFRVNIFYTRRGLASVMRSIPSKIPTFADLGL